MQEHEGWKRDRIREELQHRCHVKCTSTAMEKFLIKHKLAQGVATDYRQSRKRPAGNMPSLSSEELQPHAEMLMAVLAENPEAGWRTLLRSLEERQGCTRSDQVMKTFMENHASGADSWVAIRARDDAVSGCRKRGRKVQEGMIGVQGLEAHRDAITSIMKQHKDWGFKRICDEFQRRCNVQCTASCMQKFMNKHKLTEGLAGAREDDDEPMPDNSGGDAPKKKQRRSEVAVPAPPKIITVDRHGLERYMRLYLPSFRCRRTG